MQTELELEVFRAGDYGPKGKWSGADLDQIAGDYRASLHEAPVTLDHAQSGPALGWVESLKRQGNLLIARLRGLNPGLLELLRREAFKKRSVELYANLPETGRPYLKAVSFLGAATPAVKGLSDLLFTGEAASAAFRAEHGEYIAWDFEDEEDGSSPLGNDDEPPASAAAPAVPPSPLPSAPARASLPGSLDFAETESLLRREGRWIPAWKAMGIREFFTALAALDEIEIDSDQSLSPSEWFVEFLNSLPPFLPMGEAAGMAPPFRSFNDSVSSAIPISPSSLELHRRAAALCQTRVGLDYAGALLECARS